MTLLSVIASEAWQSRESKTQKSKGKMRGKNKSKLKDQSGEGFCIFSWQFDLLCLIFGHDTLVLA